ncbi:hypothetical protein ACLB6K_13520 [Microcystis aeruginosa FACHB-524]|uniref:hypothetical protein n=1 Tax=Microcystis TaxID=1125 RepID=UPI000F45D714|nr:MULTISPECIES: hypothetical protein [Microcystis]ROI02458.1 hypothetical protein ED562_13190 [Microcystis aeruginosa FACHB-524]
MNIQLSNPVDRSLSPLETAALADTGALHLCIPAHIQIQLKWLFVTWYGSIGGHKSTKSLSGKGFN